MKKQRWFSTGEAAQTLGISRDSLIAALRAGAPDAKTRIAGRRMFSTDDLTMLASWFNERGRPVNWPLTDGRANND